MADKYTREVYSYNIISQYKDKVITRCLPIKGAMKSLVSISML